MPQKLKRFFALATVILIVLFVIATFIVALLDFPKKMAVFTGLAAGMVFLPVMAWLFLWMIGLLTKKKNIASFRNEEMEKTMEQAEQIKQMQNEEK